MSVKEQTCWQDKSKPVKSKSFHLSRPYRDFQQKVWSRLQISISPFPHWGHFSLQPMVTITEEHSQLKCILMEPSPSGYIYNTTLAPKAWVKRGWKDCKSQRIREFAVRLYVLVVSEATPIKSHQHDCPKVKKDSSSRHSKVDGRKPTRPQPYTKNYG